MHEVELNLNQTIDFEEYTMPRLCLAILFIFGFKGMFDGAAHAAVFSVGTRSDCTHYDLSSALRASAQNGPGLDEIHLTVNSRVYGGSIENQSVRIIGGYPDCSLTSQSNQNTAILLDPNSQRIYFRVRNQLTTRQNVYLERLTIRDENLPFAVATRGLSIVGNVRVVLDQSEISSHHHGGIVIAADSDLRDRPSLELIRTTLRDNRAELSGGAIDCFCGDIDLALSEVSNNQADFNGGAIDLNRCNYRQRGSILSGNRANLGHGGAIHSVRSSLDFRNYYTSKTKIDQSPMIRGNHALYGGGGIALAQDSILTASDLALWGNQTAYEGSALLASASIVRFDRSALCDDHQPFQTRRCADVSDNQMVASPDFVRHHASVFLKDGTYGEFNRINFHHNKVAPAFPFSGQTALFSVLDDSMLVLSNALIAQNSLGTLVEISPVSGDDKAMLNAQFLTVAQNDFSRGVFWSSANGAARIKLTASVIEETETILPTLFDATGSSADCTISLTPINGIPNHRALVASAELDTFAVTPFLPSYVPTPDSPAIDYCALTPLSWTGGDLLNRSREVDIASKSNVFGAIDVGAFEVRDLNLP